MINWLKSNPNLFSLEERRQRRDIRIICYCIFVFFGAGIASIIAFANCSPPVPIMWAFACYSAAAGVGFLFGVPRVDPSQSEMNSTNNILISRRLKVNTNIEQISDWLAKIVVGVTLVQLNKLPGFIHHMAQVFASDACSGKCSENFAIALIVYFISIGLVAGYLLTRTYLSEVFSRADGVGNSTAVSILAANLTDDEYLALSTKEVSFEDDSFSEPQKEIGDPALKQATEKLSSLPIDEIHTSKALVLWARAMIGKGNYSAAVGALERAISQSDGTAEYYYEYAVALYFADPNREDETATIPTTVHDALCDAYKRLRTCDALSIHRSVYIGLVFYALYVPPPGGFEEAIRFGEEYLEKYEKVLPSGRLYFYLSAAYGQKVRYYNTIAKDDEARIKALDFAKKAIVRDAGTYLPLLQSLVNPSKDEPLDNDLQVFSADPEFLKVLGLPSPTTTSSPNNQ